MCVEKKEVLFFMENYSAGGLDKVVRDLIENISADKIHLVVNKNIDRRIILANNLPSNILVYKYSLLTSVDVSNWAHNFKKSSFMRLIAKSIDYILRYPLVFISFFYFLYFIRKIKPTVFITHNGGYPAALYCGTAAIAANVILKKKSIYVYHSIPRNYSLSYLFFDRLFDLLIDKTCNLVSVSKKTSNEINIVRKIKQYPICIYNGIKALSIKNHEQINDLKLLHVGTIDFNKNQILLIEAINILILKGNTNISVTFVGATVEEDAQVQLNKLITKYKLEKYVNFMGFKDNVSEFYLENDILICTSKIEGFPIVILEAMRVGMPIISTNVGGINEQITDGLNGFLINENDYLQLSNKIDYFSKNKNNVALFGKKSHEIFLKRFTLEKMVMNYEKQLFQN